VFFFAALLRYGLSITPAEIQRANIDWEGIDIIRRKKKLFISFSFK